MAQTVFAPLAVMPQHLTFVDPTLDSGLRRPLLNEPFGEGTGMFSLSSFRPLACNRLMTAPMADMRRPSHAGTRPSSRGRSALPVPRAVPSFCDAICRECTREMNRASWAQGVLMLADPLSSSVSGASVAVTGGKPFL